MSPPPVKPCEEHTWSPWRSSDEMRLDMQVCTVCAKRKFKLSWVADWLQPTEAP